MGDEHGNNFLMLLLISDSIIMEESKLSYVRYLVSYHENFNISAVNNAGSTILHISCETGNLNVFNYLIENTDLSLNQKNFDGITPPMGAISSRKMNYTKTFDFLKQIILQKSFDVNIQDLWGWTILHRTFFFGCFKMAKYILEFTKVNVHEKDINGNNILSTLFITPYVEYGTQLRLEMVQMLIKQYNVSVIDENNDGETILHIASKTSNLDIFNYLINSQKIDVNKKDKNGNTPLLLLLENCELSELEIFRTVIDLDVYHHVNLYDENIYGTTATKICVSRGFYIITNYIMNEHYLRF